MITRIIVQRKRFKRFRKVEWQTIIATVSRLPSVAISVRLQSSHLRCQVLLVFPLWTSQVLTNHYGSGLHVQNVPPEFAIPFWNVSASTPLVFRLALTRWYSGALGGCPITSLYPSSRSPCVTVFSRSVSTQPDLNAPNLQSQLTRFLQVPHTFRTFRRLVHLLCVVIMGLGIAEALVWTFQCEPFMSNFDYNVESTWCANIDAARFCTSTKLATF